MPCGFSCGRVLLLLIVFGLSALMVYWAIFFPENRLFALLVIVDAMFFYFRLWHFLPWERAYTRSVAKDMVASCVGGPENYRVLVQLIYSSPRVSLNAPFDTL